MASGSLNRVMLIGTLGRDPEVRSFSNGNRVCNLSVATSESWKDKSTGERKEKTEWHRVAIFNDRLVDVCEKYLVKGQQVFLEGQLETRKYTDQSGAERYTTEIVLAQYRGQLLLLDRADRPPPSEDSYGTTKAAAAPQTRQPADADDDIPF